MYQSPTLNVAQCEDGLGKKLCNGKLLNEAHSIPEEAPVDSKYQRTDLRKWRLHDERGRQTWHYLRSDTEIESWSQSTADKYFLGLPTV